MDFKKLEDMSDAELTLWLLHHHEQGDCHKSLEDGCSCDFIRDELRSRGKEVSDDPR